MTDRYVDALGVRRPHTAPTGIEAVDTAAAAWHAEWDTYRALENELRELTENGRAREAAERTDDLAFKTARLAGKPDPGGKHVAAWAARIEDLGRRRRGHAAISAEMERRYLDVLEQHASEVAADRDRRLAEARAAAAHVVELLGETLTDLAAAHVHAAWVAAGPGRQLQKVRVAVTVKGDRMQLGHLLAAFREHVALPAVSEEPAGMFLEPAEITAARPIGAQRGATPPDAA